MLTTEAPMNFPKIDGFKKAIVDPRIDASPNKISKKKETQPLELTYPYEVHTYIKYHQNVKV